MDKREIRAMHDITTATRRITEALRRNGQDALASKLDRAVRQAITECQHIKEEEDND